MLQFANTHYVYDERGRNHPSNLLKSTLILVSIFVMVGMSSFGVIQIGRVVDAATNYALPTLPVPSKPTLSPVVVPIEELKSAELESKIEAWIAKHPEHKWSVGIQGLGEDNREVLVQDSSYLPASLYKILLVPAFFDKYSLEDLDKIRLNKQPLRVCFEKMLLRSDNPCGEAIASRLVGWRQIEQNLQANGFTSLSLNNPAGLEVTAKDMTTFMGDFYESKLTSKKVRNYVVSLLERQQLRRGIPAGCSECIVANKTGDNKVRHDASVIKYGSKTYALTILSDGGSYAEIADLTRLIHAEMSK